VVLTPIGRFVKRVFMYSENGTFKKTFPQLQSATAFFANGVLAADFTGHEHREQ